MRHFRLMSGRTGIALVASYMLVLQALFGAFALGADASAPLLDAFGNPLCVTGSGKAGIDNHRGEHTPLPDCCTAACNMSVADVADGRSRHSLANPLPVSPAQSRASFEVVADVPALERAPGSPRPPPSML